VVREDLIVVNHRIPWRLPDKVLHPLVRPLIITPSEAEAEIQINVLFKISRMCFSSPLASTVRIVILKAQVFVVEVDVQTTLEIYHHLSVLVLLLDL
jgi:hypothetical protein